jgi:hypothetical protein
MSVAMVVTVPVIMPVSGKLSREAVRLEHFDRTVKMNAEPLERLSQPWIVGGKQPRGLRLDGKMEIANGPADESGGIGRKIERNFQHGLGFLAHRVTGLGCLPYRFTVVEGFIQLKSEFHAVLGCRPPKEFRKPLPVDADWNLGKSFNPWGEGGAYEMHAGKEQIIFQMSRANLPGAAP